MREEVCRLHSKFLYLPVRTLVVPCARCLEKPAFNVICVLHHTQRPHKTAENVAYMDDQVNSYGSLI